MGESQATTEENQSLQKGGLRTGKYEHMEKMRWKRAKSQVGCGKGEEEERVQQQHPRSTSASYQETNMLCSLQRFEGFCFFDCLVWFGFGGHTERCSRVTPGSIHTNHSWKAQGTL